MNRISLAANTTPLQITGYLSKHTIHRCILNKVNNLNFPSKPYKFTNLEELLLNLDETLCQELLSHILPNLSILDPACGSGDFLVSALNILLNIYIAVINKIIPSSNSNLPDGLIALDEANKNSYYSLKKKIIVENLFGVDISKEAVETTCSRLYTALIDSTTERDEIDLLSDIHFNIMLGNALIGLLHTDEEDPVNDFT